MSTLPPPTTNKSPKDSVESKAYGIAEELKEYLPIINDRNRLGFNLYLYVKGEGDKPEALIKNLKLNIQNISSEKLLEKINDQLQKIKIKEG